MSFLDEDGVITDVACRSEDGKYVDWSTSTTNYKPSSGLAMAEVDGQLRRFFIDDHDSLVQGMNEEVTQLGSNAAQGSQVAAAVPVGSTDIHAFYLSENNSLTSLTFNGRGWSSGIVVALAYLCGRATN